LRELSIPVQTVSLSRPSLDNVFIKLTGHAIRDEEAGDVDRLRTFARAWGGRRR
jgi:ABC-2 type transport system ATP-binding protein